LDVAVYPTLPTIMFSSPASRQLGMAIANPRTNVPINVNLDIRDSNGIPLANTVTVNIPPSGHRSFFVFDAFPNVANFSGTLTISAANTAYLWDNNFIAMTLSGDDGLWSGLPSGSYQWPISHRDRIRCVFNNIVNAAIKNNFLVNAPQLIIDRNRILNAYARSNGIVVVSLGLSQLISDSQSELAHVIGHEVGHIIQYEHGGLPSNAELDADMWGVTLALAAGYDPYAGAGVLGKLEMASGMASLLNSLFDDLLDPHYSIVTRLGNMYQTLNNACNYNAFTLAQCNMCAPV
jgi:hypothetical protein